MPIRPVNARAAYGVLVGVYKNLGTRDPKRQWSVRALEGPSKGLKVAEGDSGVLTGCGAYVRESTRQRMIAGSVDQAKGHKGHREVHAWLTGYLCDEDAAPAGRRVTYRPFERGEFFTPCDGQPFGVAERVVFASDGFAYTD
jgi:hypothetical protein